MNKKQKICLWIGIAAIALMGLFPPVFIFELGRWADRDIEYRFLLNTGAFLALSELLLQWAVVAAGTGVLIYALEDKKPKDEQRTQCKSKVTGPALTVVFLIVVIAILVFLLVRSYVRPTSPPRSSCQVQLRGLGMAITIYAGEDEHQRLPTADKWCDLLIQGDFTTPKQFVCRCIESDAIFGESSYAINANIAGKSINEIPDDVVLLFETNFGINPLGRHGQLSERSFRDRLSYARYNPKGRVYRRRWNQFGGPEILTTENHGGKGCNIVFKDRRVDFVPTQRLGTLKWKPDPNDS